MGASRLPDRVAQGYRLFQAGKLDEADALFRQILEAEPHHAIAMTMRGTIQAQQGRLPEAARLLRASLEVDPRQPDALYNCGIVLAGLERFDEALGCYDRALALVPGNPAILNNRGNALAGLKRFDEALANYEQAAALDPRNPDAFLNRGMVLSGLNRHEDALASYERALALRPDDPEAHFHRANALAELKRAREAVDAYDRALALDPRNALAFNNRGNTLADLCRHKAALESYDRALSLKPDFPDALFNRGMALTDLRRHEDALDSFQRALALQPDAGRELPYARGFVASARLQLCDWSAEGAIDGILASCLAGNRAVVPFDCYMMKDSAVAHYRCARTYAADKYPTPGRRVWRGERRKHDRIRLAYASFDFRDHPVAHQFAGVVEHHDRTRFETTALSLHPGAPDAMQQRLRRAFEHFVDIGNRSDLEAASLLGDLEIDILVDLTGFTTGGRVGIFTRRPAPIQANWLGNPGTAGTEHFDYIIGDGIVIPDEHRDCYVEKVARLPECYLPGGATRLSEARIPARAEAGLPERGFVFCSFNNSYKFRPAMFDVWMRLLHGFEGSVLWLRGANPAVTDNLRREATARGVDPARLVFAPYVRDRAEHLARQGLADLFLDTLPYNAHSTAADALWAGLPVLTCLGGAFPGRVAASLVNAAGLPELVTRSLEEYEALAAALVREPDRLRSIRDKLARNRRSQPLFDVARFTRHLEAAYGEMWRIHERGEAPRHLSIAPLGGTAAGAAIVNP